MITASTPQTVGDVADVYRARETPPASLAITDGRPGILIGIAMNEGLQLQSMTSPEWGQSIFEVRKNDDGIYLVAVTSDSDRLYAK